MRTGSVRNIFYQVRTAVRDMHSGSTIRLLIPYPTDPNVHIPSNCTVCTEVTNSDAILELILDKNRRQLRKTIKSTFTKGSPLHFLISRFRMNEYSDMLLEIRLDPADVTYDSLTQVWIQRWENNLKLDVLP